jgi:hypothetical protein
MSDPRLRSNFYRFYTKDHDVADAVRLFRLHYGVMPSETPFTDDKHLYVGPTPEKAARPAELAQPDTNGRLFA